MLKEYHINYTAESAINTSLDTSRCSRSCGPESVHLLCLSCSEVHTIIAFVFLTHLIKESRAILIHSLS